jgi:Tol biopolymer transport system component
MPIRRFLLASLVLGGLAVACSASESPPPTVMVEIDNGLETEPSVVFPLSGELGLLAFIRDGNLWVKPLPDGLEVQVTARGGYTSPRWSRDGQWLAADQYPARWLFGHDGRRLLLWDEWPGCAPPSEPAECAMTRLQTAPVRTDPELLLPAAVVRPGGGELALASRAGPPAGSPAAMADPDRAGKPGELMLVELATGTTRILATARRPAGWWLPAAWSADGRYLIAHEHFDLSASAMAGGLPLRAIDGVAGTVTDLPGTLLYSDYVVPGPRAVAIVAGGGREAWTGSQLEIVSFPADGPAVSAEPSGVPEGSVASPAWAPDGTHLAYVVGPDLGPVGGGEPAREGLMLRRIYLHDLATGTARQLLDDAAYRDEHPEWSIDGEHILFARFDESDRVSVWLASTGANPAPAPQADGLTIDPQTTWFGYYGHIDWDEIYDWWQPGGDR